MKNVTVSMPIEEYNKLKEMAAKGEQLEKTVEELEEAKHSIKLTVSTLDSKIAPVIFQNISDIAKGKKVISTKQNELIEYVINGEKVEVSHNYIYKEIEKYRKALARLNDLYIFSGMSEKDYLVKKKDIEDKLKSLKNKKPAIKKKVDDDFLNLASYYLINNEFMGRGKIDFRNIVDNVDKEILKQFLHDIINDIKIHDGKVSSIVYANGSVVVITD